MKAITPFIVVFSVATALPVNYDVTVTCDKVVCEETAGTARAFRLPESSETVTGCSITLAPSEALADGYRVTFNTFEQNLYMGETVFADEENLSKSVPGKWVEFTLPGLAAGELTRDPNLTVESEYLDCGLVAFMLLYEGEGEAADETVFSVVERVLPRGNSAKSVVGFALAENGPGEIFDVSVNSELSQDTGLSKMTGLAALSGTVRRTVSEDGLADYARAELAGTRARAFTIAGKDNLLKEDVKVIVDILREGSTSPAECGE